LGLAIARHVVEAHGGRMKVESVIGQGSIFTFTLPVAIHVL
jgi:two-component system phosphate regulon sensor histidine kinase PhoR